MKISEIAPAPPQVWDFIWDQCRYATFFHSREWAEIWHKYTKGELSPAAQLITFNDGREALLPLCVEKTCRNFVSTFHSSPAGTFGGWLSLDNLSSSHVQTLVRYLSGLSGVLWRLNPHDPNSKVIRVPFSQPDETFVIALDGPNTDLLRTWSRGARDAVGQAKRAGVTIRRGSGLADWKAYFEIYSDSLRRWGQRATSKYTLELFKLLGSSDSGHIHLWLAEHEGEVVAGAVNFTSGQLVVGWNLAALETRFKVRPVNLLLFESIEAYAKSGFALFDLGTSGGHENIKAFKKRFGATQLPAPFLAHHSQITRAVLAAQRIKSKLVG
jgi:hypothetical protein